MNMPENKKDQDLPVSANILSILQGTRKAKTLLIYILLAAATFIAFEQVRNNGFVSYDDSDYVTENEHVAKGITPESIRWSD
jgi:hypothetical protein